MELILTLLAGIWFSQADAYPGDELTKKEIKAVQRYFLEPVELIGQPWPQDTALLHGHLNAYDGLYRIQVTGGESGYVLRTRAMGRFEYFDYLVIFSGEAEVIGIEVTRYRSDHGAGICQRGWLNQFKGYVGGELQLGKDIDGVSGGTISAGSLVADIQRCHRLMEQVLAQ